MKSTLQDKKIVAKKKRSWYESKFESTKQVCVVRLNENKAVVVALNFLVVETMKSVLRCSQTERKRTKISQPFMIS